MSNKKDSLGDRMKAHEAASSIRLTSQVPVLARLDGKAFHTFAKQFKKPYDPDFHACMWAAAKYLCEHIQSVRVAYVQSDEITLLLTQKNVYAQGWFDYNLQKMCSVAAGWCSVAFYDALRKRLPDLDIKRLPTFDARFWSVAEHEVQHNFVWRQNDAIRNSIQALGQAHFSPKQLHGVNCMSIKDKLLNEEGVLWNAASLPQQRGVCIVPETYETDGREGPVTRKRWAVDENIPLFPDDPNYIKKFLVRDED